jgi:hypothetical protein
MRASDDDREAVAGRLRDAHADGRLTMEDHTPYFWPIWVGGPWGAVLLARTLFGHERERLRRQDGERDHR